MEHGERLAEIDPLLEAKRQVAIAATERLLAACRGYEKRRWLNRYDKVLDALFRGDLRTAIFDQCRTKDDSGVAYPAATWILSADLAEEVREAISRIRTHLYGDDREPMSLSAPIHDVTSNGSIEEEQELLLAKYRAACKHDPIEDDPQYAAILKEADELADEALVDDPMRGQLGYCHFFWWTKQEILRQRFGIEWKTPMEMNPNTFFD